jgi:two-component system, NtrC family, sensor kinase
VASLFVIQGRDQGRRFELDKPLCSIGRETTNDIQLRDTEVSRQHAMLRQEDGEFSLVDLNSSNGCFINSRRIEQGTLQNGDRVQIGRSVMIFTYVEEQESEDLANVIDIEPIETGAGGSRIVKSLSQEPSGVFDSANDPASPWLARARSNLQIMYSTALAVSHTLDIDQLLQRIMEMIFEWVEADRGLILLVDGETDELLPKVRLMRPNVRSEEKIIISRTILDYVMDRKEGVLTTDAREDDRFEAAGSIVKLGVREAICVPMQGRYGIVGVIYIDTYTPPGQYVRARSVSRFTEEHLKLMVAIGHQAALAVEDTSYYSAMVQAERLAAIGQTIAMLSHHIKNILQGIRGGSYLIEEGLKSESTDLIGKGWKIVEKNQERISALVLDMLTFSKEREPDMMPADLNTTTADVIELMEVRAAETGVDLRWEPDPKMPELTFDPEAMHRAILNVVTNAIDACEGVPQPCVIVSTQLSKEHKLAQVDVRDNGPGIPEDQIKKIFALFESAKGARGTGLGLPVSQKILHEHGGDIVIESIVGKGTRFSLQLPMILPSHQTGDLGTIGG